MVKVWFDKEYGTFVTKRRGRLLVWSEAHNGWIDPEDHSGPNWGPGIILRDKRFLEWYKRTGYKTVKKWKVKKSKAYRPRHRHPPLPYYSHEPKTPRTSKKRIIRNVTIFALIIILIGGVYHHRAFVIPLIQKLLLTRAQVAEELDTVLIEIEIFRLINERRENRNLTVLQPSDLLAEAAKKWSDFLAMNDLKGDITHGNFLDRMKSIGKPYGCGEIIACIPLDSTVLSKYKPAEINATLVAEAFVDCWVMSPGHNMIMHYRCIYGEMGVGVSRNGTNFYGVVDFYFGT